MSLYQRAMGEGERHMGFSSPKRVVIEDSFTRPANTTAYTSLDAVNGSASAPVALIFTNANRLIGGAGTVKSVAMSSSAAGTAPTSFMLFLFDVIPTMTNDNTAFSLTDANMLDCFGVVNLLAADEMPAAASTVYRKGQLGHSVRSPRTYYLGCN